MIKTIFIDIDGTIIKQKNNLSNVMIEDIEILPGVLEAFDSWNWKGYKIVLVTGRKESSREVTERTLKKAGLFWDHLIMGLDAGGSRVLINDSTNPEIKKTASSITLQRDQGISQNLLKDI